ncbi:PAS domain-containing protein [Cytophagaceae bacterium ABcell3]|nr:PAS domain-containing protein [Cytophagaceae bacterium ABcell3]
MKQQRLEDINELIIQIASGNYDIKKPISENKDDYDALITGINMLGDELKHTTVSKDYLKSVFSGIVDLLLITSTDHNIIEINSSVTKLLHYNTGDLSGKSVATIMKGSNKALKGINTKLENGDCCQSIEREFRTKSGEYIPVSCSVSYLYDKNKNKTGILYIRADAFKFQGVRNCLTGRSASLITFIGFI